MMNEGPEDMTTVPSTQRIIPEPASSQFPGFAFYQLFFNFTSYKVHQIEVQEMRINDQRPKTLLQTSIAS